MISSSSNHILRFSVWGGCQRVWPYLPRWLKARLGQVVAGVSGWNLDNYSSYNYDYSTSMDALGFPPGHSLPGLPEPGAEFYRVRLPGRLQNVTRTEPRRAVLDRGHNMSGSNWSNQSWYTTNCSGILITYISSKHTFEITYKVQSSKYIYIYI